VAKLFISYARRDGKELANRLAANLEYDHDPWLDTSKIPGGPDWSLVIERAIDQCEVLLVLLTTGSYNSSICRGEQLRGLRKDKLVIPLLAEAGADRPVYLEAANYVDFTNTDAYEESLRALRSSIETGEGVRLQELPTRIQEKVAAEERRQQMAALVGGRYATWSEVCSLAKAQQQRYLEGLAGRRSGAAIFDSALYVNRRGQEGELDRFVDSDDALGLILIGDSGVGKTNLLCQWTDEEVRNGHAVLMYNGDRLRSDDVGQELAGDLDVEDSSSLREALDFIDGLADQEKRRLIIVFDGINDFRGRRDQFPRDLLAGIDDLISDLSGTSIRVVMSCTRATWNRMDRLNALRLNWSRYHRTAEDEEILVLPRFDAQEVQAAYQRYREYFHLVPRLSDLSAALQKRLQDPVVLRLLAMTLSDEKEQTQAGVLDTEVFERYYRQHVRRRDDSYFIEEIAWEMYESEHAALPVQQLARHPTLGEEMRNEEATSTFNRMLDAGVLMQVQGDLFSDDLLKFTYPMIGAYALARRLLREPQALAANVRGLVAKSAGLAMAWEAGVVMLSERGDAELLSEFAGSADPELREVAAESLIRLHGTDRDRTRSILDELLRSHSSEQQRTALRAAYLIGPDTRDLFLQAAMSGSRKLRQMAHDTLYLIWAGASGAAYETVPGSFYFIWRQAPDFTYELMQDMVGRVSWTKPIQAHRVLRFVLALSITIYVNHCDRDEVPRQTADLFYELTVNRLHLDQAPMAGIVDRVVSRVVGTVFANRLLNWMLFAELGDRASFFAIPAHARAPLKEVAALLNPQSSIGDSEDLLLTMLQSDERLFRGSATLVSAVHAHARWDDCESIQRRLFDALDGRGRLWQLMGYCVLLRDTPSDWTPLLEEFTGRLLTEHADIVYSEQDILQFRIFLVPLGLAYGKCGQAMPLFDELLADAIGQDDENRVAQIVAWLGPVGFYYPDAVFTTLEPHLEFLQDQSRCRESLITTLAAIRTLHLDVVDSFITRSEMEDALRRGVTAAADIELVHRFMHLIGYYNNAVHYCALYPRMRQGLAVFALELLADADSASDFVARYTQQAIGMARKSDFRLLQWTERD